MRLTFFETFGLQKFEFVGVCGFLACKKVEFMSFELSTGQSVFFVYAWVLLRTKMLSFIRSIFTLEI